MLNIEPDESVDGGACDSLCPTVSLDCCDHLLRE